MVTRFVDEYLDDDIVGMPVVSSPRWNTAMTQVDSGAEQANQRWSHPLHRYDLPEGVREYEDFVALRDHWMVMRGPFHTWPFRDPLDFASVELDAPNVEPVVSSTDQTIGTGDGLTTDFQLTKLYTRGSQTYTRNIYKPVVSSVVVAVAGVDPSTLSPDLTWSVSRTTGIITFDTPPSPSEVVTAGFLYDVEVRFESDDAFEGTIRSWQVAGFGGFSLFEVRPCQ